MLFDPLPLMLNVFGQSFAVLAVALVAERVCRRNATARHAVLLCGLVGALTVPGVALVEHRLGICLLSLPITSAGGPIIDLDFFGASTGEDATQIGFPATAHTEASRSTPWRRIVANRPAWVW